jgi:all-trans-8'-apo-beta-carotenal 15,15'-oxygenase
MINFSRVQKVSPQECTLTVYEFEGNTDDVTPVKQRDFTIPGLPFFHDFVVTENYYIFNRAPTSFDPLPFVLGQKGPAECIVFDKHRPAVVYLVSRNDPTAAPVEVEVDAHFNFHFANAFECPETGEVCFDVVKCDDMQLGSSGGTVPLVQTVDYAKDVPFSTLVRYTFTPKKNGDNSGSGSGSGNALGFTYSSRTLSGTQVDFVSVSPAVSCVQHRYVYGACGTDPSRSSPVQGLVKIDTFNEGKEEVWVGERFEYLGESIFVPRVPADAGTDADGAEDYGYVMSLLYNGRDDTSEFVIFDGQDISKGPISRQPLPVKVPFGLHGMWASGLVFDSDTIMRRHKACRALDTKAGWNTMTGGFSGLGITQDMFNS